MTASAASAAGPAPVDRFFETSDGVRLHYVEAGEGPTLVFVPGWTMPAVIWRPQIEHFAPRYRVIALDPRSQGDSAIAASGHEPVRRGRDIAELLDRLGESRVVLVGWSLGVLDVLAHVTAEGDRRIAGLVLVDNSVGEDPPPRAGRGTFLKDLRRDREATVRKFVAGMYRKPDPNPSVEEITRYALRTPLDASLALLAYPWPRERWREAVYAVERPVLYAVTPRLAGQAENLARRHPQAATALFADAGHALFVDDAVRFNRIVDEFLQERVWRDARSTGTSLPR